MSNNLINFALAKSIYSEKKNYLDTFSPFVVRILAEEDKEFTIDEIESTLMNKYNLKIPIHSLKSILSLLANKNYVELDKNQKNYPVILAKSGRQYFQETFESHKIINRRHSRLFKVFQEFSIKNYDIKYELEGIESEVDSFIVDNLLNLVYYTFGETGQSLTKLDKKEFNNHFSDFICVIEESDPELFDIFQELLKGAILWNEIACKDNVEKESDFDYLEIYLDANYLISLLGLDSPQRKKGANQLFELLKRNPKLKLRVLKITLDEISRLLSEYKKQKYNYFEIPINNIFYFLNKEGFDDAAIDLLINDLYEKCERLGVEIVSSKLLNPEKFNDEQKEFYDNLYKFNTELNKKNLKKQRGEIAIHNSTLHDTTAMSIVSKKRGAWVRSLEKSKAIFLTSSFRLDRIVNELSKRNKQFPETILDITLTNILWLKNPENDIGCSIQHIINVHSKNYLIDNGIWRKFVATIKELRRKDKINDEDYAHLISNNQLTFNFLKDNEQAKITSDEVLKLRDKIISDQIVTERELKRAKELLQLKERELANERKHISSLQSRLDKTENVVKSEQSDKQELSGKVKELTDRLNKRDYEERKEQEVASESDSEMKKIRKAFFITFGGYIGIGILLTIIQIIMHIPSIKTLINLPIALDILINAILISAAAIIFNKVAGMEFSTKVKWLFGRKRLKNEIKERLSKEYEQENPPPNSNPVIGNV